VEWLKIQVPVLQKKNNNSIAECKKALSKPEGLFRAKW
jgi:hypothetical protein